MRDPRATYEERRQRFRADREREAHRSRLLSRARGLTFLFFIAAGVLAEARPGPAPLILALLFLVGFVLLVVAHQRVETREKWAATMLGLNEEGEHRLDRNWEALPHRDAEQDLRAHPFAGDLDLFGRPALAQLLGPTSTPPGRRRLEEWLLSAAQPELVHERQEAVRELAPLNELRDTIAAHGREAGAVDMKDVDAFLRWAEDPLLVPSHPAWLWTARILPFITALTLVLEFADVGPPRLWILPLMVAAALSFGRPGRSIRATFRRAFAREGMFRGYPFLMGVIAAAQYRAAPLERLRRELTAGGLTAKEQMKRLLGLMHLADLRYSGMIYLPVQLLTLWDFHVMARVDAWRQVAGGHVRRWLEAAAEFEALSALAVLAHDHPSWAFPEIQAAGTVEFAAAQLGHPMLPADVRVDNDVTVGPPGTFLLVTGSNMSGKSTLLRAIGLNTVLAQAGAPACARQLSLPHVMLCTSIHVEDSLVRGVSFFMAQLQRMKLIVSTADRAAQDGGRVLYLLDEILQGTNTAERRIAATRVIRHLLQRGAIGAVTTHDLELAIEPALADAARPVHLRESVSADGGPLMTFDYKLRPGVATSTNALKLMELVGLTD